MSTPYASRRVQCLLCEKTPTLNNLTTHLKNMHPDRYTPGQPRRDFFAELPRSVVAVPTPPPPAVTIDDGMTADDIVLPAIMALALPGNVVPVSHLGALFVWRDQTAAMLAAISGKAAHERPA